MNPVDRTMFIAWRIREGEICELWYKSTGCPNCINCFLTFRQVAGDALKLDVKYESRSMHCDGLQVSRFRIDEIVRLYSLFHSR